MKILAYHKISYKTDFGINSIDPKIFRRQMETLIEQGYTPLTFRELSNIQAEQPIIITFDDGYESVYHHALPILRELNIKAVIFVVSEYIGKLNGWESFPILRTARHLNRSQILELQEYGCEIGSHSRSHHYLPSVPTDTLTAEVEDSKKCLEEICQREIISFCYPYGRYNRRVVEAVDKAGYTYATGNIYFNQQPDNNLTLTRRSIYRVDSSAAFLSKTQTNSNNVDIHFLKEWIIQKGTIPGITRNIMQNLKF